MSLNSMALNTSNIASFISTEALTELGPIIDTLDCIATQLRLCLISIMPQASLSLQQGVNIQVRLLNAILLVLMVGSGWGF
jgi:hypothetical protein